MGGGLAILVEGVIMGHHFVPRRYLKGFRSAESNEKKSFIWMYDKLKGTATNASIDTVAQQAGFYDEDVEDELNKQVEIPGNDVINKIQRCEPISEFDRMHLTYYIATMIRRVPAARAKAEQYIPQIVEEVPREFRAWVEEAHRVGDIDDETLARRLAEITVAEEKFKKQPPEEVINQIRTPWPFQSMLVVIHSMNWRVIRTAGPSFFLTSDNPVSFFEDRGLGHHESEVTFPLCSDMLLHCGWQRCAEMTWEDNVKEYLVKEFNRRTAVGAKRFVFYHKKADWILSVMQNGPGSINRINWVPSTR